MDTIIWTTEELEVFDKLGVGEGNVSLRKLIRGQREINGRLYLALKLILDSLPAPAPVTSQEPTPDKVDQARELVGGIPGPPPGCDDKVGGVASWT